MPSKASQDWDSLVAWFEECHVGFRMNIELRDTPGVLRGLVVTEDVKERATLLHIPAASMLNPLTLLASDSTSKVLSKGPNFSIPRHLFPQPSHVTSAVNSSKRLKTSPAGTDSSQSKQLDTTELLTLHLALSRDPHKRYTSDWQVYLETLPKDFRPWHPLTWLVKPDPGTKEAVEGWNWWADLYENHASPTLKSKVAEVKKRYDADKAVILSTLRTEEPFKSHSLATTLTEEDLLWAWLNINTRSISIPLGLPGPTERMNHTLVPILDMINHSSDPSVTAPRVKQLPAPTPTPASSTTRAKKSHKSTSSDDWASHATRYSRNGLHLVPGKIDLELIAPERKMAQGEEVMFEYGGHDNATLLAEYGFLEEPDGADDQKWLNLKYGELDVGWIVDELWAEKVGSLEEDEEDGEKGGKRKALEGIGCWGANIIHAQPSPPHPSHSLLMTLRVLHLPTGSPKLTGIQQGYSTYVSPSNELAVMSSLEHICTRVVQEAEKRLKNLKKLDKELKAEKGAIAERQAMLEMMEGLYTEEKVLSKSILERIEAGEDLS
ncbi:hypothetical protein L202_06935 [Cryptococcus amylolentus CBS 6039]|uniref:Rubisco LSMT substrate-binding domain-containing protein n=2 Tax=Cryptococcus amylolentus TaxID=104669 RepID=A0A1E3HE11_9TREE|nr:hypothetical protein L202_06935 [Cryptococcus amylolentus CBS 6039]ODN74573.1 hypothetical protein L202_06935 [Cryptococcus amylolentus CBS 6039]ODO01538.1 hypothetical protein I350_06358 [Cryptococcus amylolentus CBS 6273]